MVFFFFGKTILNYLLSLGYTFDSAVSVLTGSDHMSDFGAKKYSKRMDKSVFSLGARYTFQQICPNSTIQGMLFV